MKYLVTGKEMKLLDQNTSEHFHVPTEVLMEQAAMAFARQLLCVVQLKGQSASGVPQAAEATESTLGVSQAAGATVGSVLVVCGTGNNGGDGIAVARLLNQMGILAAVYYANVSGKKGSELFELQKKIYTAYGYPVAESLDDRYDVIVDAVFGIGLSRPITGEMAELIEKMNQMTGLKAALDMPSGISAEDGEVLGSAFLADVTITFSFGKAGQYLWPGAKYCGKTYIVDIGITEESWLEQKPRLAFLEDVDLKNLPVRTEDSHKGSYGKLLVIAGSAQMAGAAVLAAKAAYRMGTGLVKVVTAEENRNILLTLVPEALVSVYGKNLDKKKLIEELKWADAVVLGPGIGTSAVAEEILSTVMMNVAVPLLLDADALNLLAKEPERLLRPHMDLVVTPHLGEMSRLTGDAVSYIKSKLIDEARDFAQNYDVICVLKDAHTVTAVPYGMTYLNLSGNNGLATGGSGDVLSGIIGALLAQGLKADMAAPLGVYLHGRAADEEVSKTGCRGMMAQDILEGLTNIWKQVES